jgi:hypothetical protein
MLCLGRSNFGPADPSPGFSHPVDPHQTAVAWWDAETLARVAGLVQSKGASLHLFREDEATFSDFQQRPAVLIGAYNDQWTMELMFLPRLPGKDGYREIVAFGNYLRLWW